VQAAAALARAVNGRAPGRAGPATQAGTPPPHWHAARSAPHAARRTQRDARRPARAASRRTPRRPRDGSRPGRRPAAGSRPGRRAAAARSESHDRGDRVRRGGAAGGGPALADIKGARTSRGIKGARSREPAAERRGFSGCSESRSLRAAGLARAAGPRRSTLFTASLSGVSGLGRGKSGGRGWAGSSEPDQAGRSLTKIHHWRSFGLKCRHRTGYNIRGLISHRSARFLSKG
jgi:hypothetical protein